MIEMAYYGNVHDETGTPICRCIPSIRKLWVQSEITSRRARLRNQCARLVPKKRHGAKFAVETSKRISGEQ